MAIIERHGNGIYSREDKRGRRAYYIQYHWQGRRITETIDPDDDGVRRLKSAQRRKARVEKDKHRADFMPPHIKREVEKAEAEQEADRRTVLVFEAAQERFLTQHGDEYACRSNLDSAFRRLVMAFGGRHLDRVNRVEIRQYYLDRLENNGPFSKWPRQVSRRMPDAEIAYLSALYTFLQDEGHAIDNPCHRPRTKRKEGVLRPYKPQRKRVVPGTDQIRRLLRAEKNGKDGRALIRPKHRALFALTWYTAGSPESEPCRLTHGDVRFLEDGWAEVTYSRPKNDQRVRTLPLAPEAVPFLRAAMDDEPSRFDREGRARWAERPIFRKRKGGEPWDRSSYRKAFAAARSTVEGLEGMVLRDLRPAARTRLTDARIPEPTIKRFLGHAVSVSEHYYECSMDALRLAAAALTLKSTAVPAAGQDGQESQGASV